MAITEVTMYQARCDHCGVSAQEETDYSCWDNPGRAVDDATDSDWLLDGDVLVCWDCAKADRICYGHEHGDCDCYCTACEDSAPDKAAKPPLPPPNTLLGNTVDDNPARPLA